jgi:enterochelin esterase-like enzyme
MHDGQNLFDPRLAFSGVDWGVDETIVELIDAGKICPLIVVGIFNSPRRSYEYSPLTGGEDYARFLIGELKPMVDSQYRTLPDAPHTATIGASAGGLISIGLGWRHPEVFSRIGALSAHLTSPRHGSREAGGAWETKRHLRGEGSLLDIIEVLGPLDPKLRIYVDRGDGAIDAGYEPSFQQLRRMLLGWKRQEGRDFAIRVFKNASHTEAAWRARLAVPLEFLFGELTGP